jgi:oligopeptide/dipeptide ABC transporter ATP-binding protein
VTAPLFAIDGLGRDYATRGGGRLRALAEASLALAAGETVALVGESGSGKTTLARCAALLDRPSAGRVYLRGQELTSLSRRRLKPFRRDIQLVFQDPYGSLDPRLPLGAIVAEPLAIHGVGNRRARRERARAALDEVGLGAVELERYPHEFSGGQRQRIAIARALVLEPALLIADEPLSALDVSVQAQMLSLFRALRARFGLSYLFISHDLAAVDAIADRVAVMYLGRIVETAPRAAFFARPHHPYSEALLAAVPRLGQGKRRRASTPHGDAPNPLDPPPGCPFHPRCPKAQDLCRAERPPLAALPGEVPERLVACHFPS